MKDMRRDKMEEFFLENFNVDRVFNSIERADYLFLSYIEYCGRKSDHECGVYLTEIASAMDMSIPQVSKAVKQLQDKGYVEWKTNAQKDRTYVELTSTAIELMTDERKRMAEFYELILKEIPEEELKSMIQTMRKITAIVKKVE